MIYSEDKTQDIFDGMIRSDVSPGLVSFFSIMEPDYACLNRVDVDAFSELFSLTRRGMPAGFSIADMMNSTLGSSKIKLRYDLYAFLSKYVMLFHPAEPNMIFHIENQRVNDLQSFRRSVSQTTYHRPLFAYAMAIEIARRLNDEVNRTDAYAQYHETSVGVKAERGFNWLKEVFNEPSDAAAVQYAKIAARVFQIKVTKKDAPNFTKALLA